MDWLIIWDLLESQSLNYISILRNIIYSNKKPNKFNYGFLCTGKVVVNPIKDNKTLKRRLASEKSTHNLFHLLILT